MFLILTKIENGKEYILLQRRYNTGIWDGYYDVSCAGHLEKGETLLQAIIRETKEEIGIDLNSKNIEFSSTIHAHFAESEYILGVFVCSKWEGEPQILEPNKCDKLHWFSIDELPNNMAEARKKMIDNYRQKIIYSEYNWDTRDI